MAEHTPVLPDEVLAGLAVRAAGRYCDATFGRGGHTARRKSWFTRRSTPSSRSRILDDFSRETGIRVLAKFDIESTKTVGLTQVLMAESRRPRCDLFWNNEILNTLRLEEKGLLDVYRSPAAESYPEMCRSPK